MAKKSQKQKKTKEVVKENKKEFNKAWIVSLVLVILFAAFLIYQNYENTKLVDRMESLYEAEEIILVYHGKEYPFEQEDVDFFKEAYLYPMTYTKGALKGVEIQDYDDCDVFLQFIDDNGEVYEEFQFLKVDQIEQYANHPLDYYEGDYYLGLNRGRYYTFSNLYYDLFQLFDYYIDPPEENSGG